MKVLIKNSAISQIISIISEWPEKMRDRALREIQKEADRLRHGDYTEEERRMFVDFPRTMGEAARRTYDQIVVEAFKNEQ